MRNVVHESRKSGEARLRARLDFRVTRPIMPRQCLMAVKTAELLHWSPWTGIADGCMAKSCDSLSGELQHLKVEDGWIEGRYCVDGALSRLDDSCSENNLKSATSHRKPLGRYNRRHVTKIEVDDASLRCHSVNSSSEVESTELGMSH